MSSTCALDFPDPSSRQTRNFWVRSLSLFLALCLLILLLVVPTGATEIETEAVPSPPSVDNVDDMLGSDLPDLIDKRASAIANTAPQIPFVDHRERPSSFIASSLKNRPLPTNQWFMNMVLGSGANNVDSLPYLLRAHAQTLTVCFPRITESGTTLQSVFENNVMLGVADGSSFERHEVIAFDSLSVTVKYYVRGSSTSSMRSPIVRGSPYITAIYENASPRITSVHAITSVNGDSSLQEGREFGPATKFRLALNNQQTWILYADSPITLVLKQKGLSAKRALNGVIRIAHLPGNSRDAERVLDIYSGAYPVSGQVDYLAWQPQGYSKKAAFVQFKYQVAGANSSGEILLTTLPHHRKILDSKSSSRQQTALKYSILRGSAVGITTYSKTLRLSFWLTDITWNARQSINHPAISNSMRDELRNALRNDAQWMTVWSDSTYFGGKQLAALGRLAVIADELGETTIATQVRQKMKPVIAKYLTKGDANRQIRYDRTWGGICSTNALQDPANEFGQGWYNDHHFHWGYYLYAGAVIAKDPNEAAWATANRDMLFALARDVINPSSSDPYFTTFRNFDWYAANSWASGLSEYLDSRNQESTSEAVNAYYGALLLGLAFRNNEIRDTGHVLLQLEMLGAQTYWQMTLDSVVYPSTFTRHKVVGILWGSKADVTTWFGPNLEFIHCIQMLPFTPISEDLLRKNWIQEEYPVVKQALSSASAGWKGFIFMAHAIIDPNAALTEVRSLQSYDDGNSRTNTLHWVFTRIAKNSSG